MVNYFRDFIPKLSEVIGPLTDLTATTKRVEFVWTQEAEAAMQLVKGLIMDAVPLSYLEDEGEITLYTDASMIGIGATLMQRNSNDVE
jgi:hypothetical protein